MESTPQPSFATELEGQLPQLRKRASTLCRSRADGEDLVQETVLRALAHEQDFELGTNLRAWLMRILYHSFVSSHRRNKRERAALERFTHEPRFAEAGARVECVSELPDHIKRALGVLPDGMAKVVRLVDIDELSYREAALSLNLPVGTVMSRLYRGRERLAAELAEKSSRAA